MTSRLFAAAMMLVGLMIGCVEQEQVSEELAVDFDPNAVHMGELRVEEIKAVGSGFKRVERRSLQLSEESKLKRLEMQENLRRFERVELSREALKRIPDEPVVGSIEITDPSEESWAVVESRVKELGGEFHKRFRLTPEALVTLPRSGYEALLDEGLVIGALPNKSGLEPRSINGEDIFKLMHSGIAETNSLNVGQYPYWEDYGKLYNIGIIEVGSDKVECTHDVFHDAVWNSWTGYFGNARHCSIFGCSGATIGGACNTYSSSTGIGGTSHGNTVAWLAAGGKSSTGTNDGVTVAQGVSKPWYVTIPNDLCSLKSALEYLDNLGMDHINMSFGYYTSYVQNTNVTSCGIDATIQALRYDDVFMTAPVGNGIQNNVDFPASHPGVLAVGAVNNSDGDDYDDAELASWSTTASLGGLNANGYAVQTPMVDVLAPGRVEVVPELNKNYEHFLSTSTAWGTSYASAIAAGSYGIARLLAKTDDHETLMTAYMLMGDGYDGDTGSGAGRSTTKPTAKSGYGKLKLERHLVNPTSGAPNNSTLGEYDGHVIFDHAVLGDGDKAIYFIDSPGRDYADGIKVVAYHPMSSAYQYYLGNERDPSYRIRLRDACNNDQLLGGTSSTSSTGKQRYIKYGSSINAKCLKVEIDMINSNGWLGVDSVYVAILTWNEWPHGVSNPYGDHIYYP